MSTVDELHPIAIDLAEQAFLFRRKGNENKAKELFLEALKIEQQAAFLLPPIQESEPSRSILFRSASSIAYNAGNYEKADWLISNGLAGFPPIEIKEELKNLYEDVNFMRHLNLKGVELSKRDWLMTISGNATSYGSTAADLLMTRVDKLSLLYYRTVERLLKLPYRTTGGVSSEIKEKYGLYINAFLPGSFAVSFQVGKPDPQLPLFPNSDPKVPIDPETIIDELLNCFKILESNHPSDLIENFDDKTYYDNFIGLAKQIAPDGDKVKLVGFNVSRDGKEHPIALRKNQKQLRETSELTTEKIKSDESIPSKSLIGILMHANTPRRKKFGTVKLTETSSGQIFTIRVPISLMKDVVQPFYEEKVSIIVTEKKGKMYLEEIEISNS
ncbi:MAG: hypothetical protein ACOY90_18880 [Candidatus Zhuqueibacterota bacterium]